MKRISIFPKDHGKIGIVGEAPGREEAQYGEPFIGGIGRYFRLLAGRVKFPFSSCPITNVVHQQPPGNVFDRLPNSVIKAGKEALKEDVEDWREKGINVIVAVGAKSLEALTGHTGIYQYRGSVLPCSLIPGLKVVPIVHPGSLFKSARGGHYEPTITVDLKTAMNEQHTREITYPVRNVEIIRSESDAVSLMEYLMNDFDKIVGDIETAGPILTAYGFATSKDQAYVIVKNVLNKPNVLRKLGELTKSPLKKIFHNILFDVFHGSYYYGLLYNNTYCSMLLQHSIFPTLPKGLGFCGSFYTNEPYWKAEGKEVFDALKAGKPVDWDQLYIYCGKDCALTYEIWEWLWENEVPFWKTKHIYDHMMSLVPACLKSMYKGLRIDENSVHTHSDKNERAINILERINMETIGGVNPKSTPQLKKLIYDQWDMPKQYKGGKLSLDAKKLQTLEWYPTPYKKLISLIKTERKYRDARQFYNLTLDKDRRMRFQMKISGTYTGRFATDASITGSGRNVLNIPKSTRSFYIPENGHIFVQMDLKQAEAIVVAALCKDYDWLQEFYEMDVHKKVASFLYNIPVEQVRHDHERMTAKRVSHAKHYLLGVKLLSELLDCGQKHAKRMMEGYDKMRPELRKWQNWVGKEIVGTRNPAKRYIETCFGRIIQFFGPTTDDLKREAIAAEPQSTVGDYLNQAIVKMDNAAPKEYDFKLQVYDSILYEIPDNPSLILSTSSLLKEFTEQKINVRGVEFTIPCEFEIGYTWRDLIKYELDETEKVRDKAREKYLKRVGEQGKGLYNGDWL